MVAWERIVWVVLDSVGIGELPDAAEYGDVGRNTLGHVAESRPLKIPNLVRLGLANIAPLKHLQPAAAPIGAYGKGATRSPGKDTTTGHWEMAGVWLDQAFPVYKNGFPPDLIAEFERSIGRKTIGNKPASGTEIIKELGEEHVRTGKPIVYTSGDSVFQIAAHEDVIPIAELYRMCEIARKLLDGPNRVGRVIARPFAGPVGNFARTPRRHDYAVDPPKPMLLDVLEWCGALKRVEALRKWVGEFAPWLPAFLPRFARTDLLMITADHGCDPDPRWETTDHSREYVPILAYSPAGRAGVNLGIRETLADMGQTIAQNFGAVIPHGTSFLREAAESPSDEVVKRGTVSRS